MTRGWGAALGLLEPLRGAGVFDARVRLGWASPAEPQAPKTPWGVCAVSGSQRVCGGWVIAACLGVPGFWLAVCPASEPTPSAPALVGWGWKSGGRWRGAQRASVLSVVLAKAGTHLALPLICGEGRCAGLGVVRGLLEPLRGAGVFDARVRLRWASPAEPQAPKTPCAV